MIMNLVERGRAGDYFIPNSSTSLILHYVNNMFKKQGVGCFVNVNHNFTAAVELRYLVIT